MQVKTIQKNISNKIEDWLSSIKDESLAKDLKNKILVSGGSIVSMYMNEKVNDYDVYLRDMDIIIKICEYYTKPFKDISIFDGRKRQSYIDNNLEGDEMADNMFATSIRNLKEDQVKLYFTDGGGLRVNEGKDDLYYEPVFFSPNAISLSDDIQIVLRFHGDNEQIHKTFDFIHATCYWTHKDGLVNNLDALESIITKQLKYQGSLYPVTSIIRMKKFINRGWRISAGEILKILFQVSMLDLSDPDVLEEQLIGVDVAYFDRLIQILRGVDKEKITSSYLNTIIDRVFGESDESI